MIGVMPARVGPLEQRVDVFVAGRWEPPLRKGPFFMTVLGRLRTQSGRAAASAELRGINWRIFPLWRASYQDSKATWALADLKTRVVGDVRLMAGLALGAVGLVWLLACTNASNLLIARVTGRRRELAVRVAVGASRPRIVRLLLVESGLLAAGGGCCGNRARLGRRESSAQHRRRLLSACGRDHAGWDRAVAADWPDGSKRPPVRSHPRTARDGRARGRLAANVGTIDDGQPRSPAPAATPRRRPVRDSDPASRRCRPAPPQLERAETRGRRLRHAQPAHRRDTAARHGPGNLARWPRSGTSSGDRSPSFPESLASRSPMDARRTMSETSTTSTWKRRRSVPARRSLRALGRRVTGVPGVLGLALLEGRVLTIVTGLRMVPPWWWSIVPGPGASFRTAVPFENLARWR